MDRYFFNTDDGVSVKDDVGTDLPDIAAAQDVAFTHLVDSVRGRPAKFWETGNYRVTVCDPTGLTLFIVDLSATMAPASALLRRFD